MFIISVQYPYWRELIKAGSALIKEDLSELFSDVSDPRVKRHKKYPIGEKKQRSKTGELGKLQTVYNYHTDVQKCFKSK